MSLAAVNPWILVKTLMTIQPKILVALLIALASMNVLAEASQSEAAPVKIGIVDKSGAKLALSFLPPEEDGWQVTNNGLSASVKKDGALAGENREIEAYLITLDTPVMPISDFIERLKKNIQDAFDAGNGFKLVILDIFEDPRDRRCARMHLLLEDMRASNQQRKWSEQYALSCGSLKYRRIGFEIRYYNRYYESQNDEHFAAQATKVLDSVVFED